MSQEGKGKEEGGTGPTSGEFLGFQRKGKKEYEVHGRKTQGQRKKKGHRGTRKKKRGKNNEGIGSRNLGVVQKRSQPK